MQYNIRMNKKAEQKKKEEWKQRFIGVLGHDLKNPLSSILMGSDLLSNADSLEDVNLVAKTIKRSAVRMQLMVDNILGYAASQELDGPIFPFSASENISETFEHVIAEVKLVHPSVELNDEINLQVRLYCNEARLSQLLANLLNNAIIHGDKGSPVAVKADMTDDQLILSVENSGQPIEQKIQEQIYEPFFRGNENIKGFGLGLYIAKNIAAAHDGDLSYEHQDGKNIFTFTMPIAKESSPV